MHPDTKMTVYSQAACTAALAKVRTTAIALTEDDFAQLAFVGRNDEGRERRRLAQLAYVQQHTAAAPPATPRVSRAERAKRRAQASALGVVDALVAVLGPAFQQRDAKLVALEAEVAALKAEIEAARVEVKALETRIDTVQMQTRSLPAGADPPLGSARIQ